MKTKIKNKSLLCTQAYIGGKWVGSKGKTFPVLDPFTENEVAQVADLGREAANKAVESAHVAFAKWSGMTAFERKKLLHHVADLVEKNQEDLALILTMEQGKPLHEAKEEVSDTIDIIRWFAEEGCRVHGFTQVAPDPSRHVMTLRQPLGVVGAITPWNFPLVIAAQKAMAALAAGCTMVLKPAEDTPLTALALAKLCEEAGLPAGVFNVVTCMKPEEVGDVLTTHPLIGKFSFTGSTEVGKKLFAKCASTVKKVTLELGGNCPLIVFEDANLQKAIDGAMGLKFYNAGQCCNSINRFLVQQSIFDEFINRFLKKAKTLTIGSGLLSKNLGPLINRQAKAKVERLMSDAAKNGAEVLLEPTKTKNLLCMPAILAAVPKKAKVWQEEIFGPVAVFYPFKTEAEAISLANDTRYGLAAYLYTESLDRSNRVARALQAGSVGINTTSVWSFALPFGGWKESGVGRENGIVESLNEFCELKSISTSS